MKHFVPKSLMNSIQPGSRLNAVAGTETGSSGKTEAGVAEQVTVTDCGGMQRQNQDAGRSEC